MRSNCLIVLALWVVLSTACHKRVRVAPLPPPPPAAPPAPVAVPPVVIAEVPSPPPEPPVSPLELANRAYTSGSLDEAARGYENYLRATPPGGRQRDQVLFNLAVIYAVRSPSDWQRVSITFKQLVEEYPDSPFKAPANLLLSLHAEVEQAGNDIKTRDQRIRQLTTELDRLKKIDADRRKRP